MWSLTLKPIRCGYRGALLSAAMLTMMGIGQSAQADCAFNDGTFTGSVSGITYQRYDPQGSQYPLTPPQTSIPIPNNPPAGQVLMRMSRPLAALSGAAQGLASPYGDCARNRVERFDGNGVMSSIQGVYQTGVPGIGYRVAYYVDASNPSNAFFAPVSFTNPYASGVVFYPFSGSSAGDNTEAVIELVATGEPITGGTISAAQTYGQQTITGYSGLLLYKVSLAQNITVATPTCNTTAANLTLQLPDVSITNLVQNGGEGPKTDLTVAVSCNVVSSLSPSITVAASQRVAGTTNTLANVSTATNKAEGVGIDIWLKTPDPGGVYNPPTFSIAQPSYGTAVGSLPSQLWNFVIGANLRQLGAAEDLKAGPVQSTATLTFTYN